MSSALPPIVTVIVGSGIDTKVSGLIHSYGELSLAFLRYPARQLSQVGPTNIHV